MTLRLTVLGVPITIDVASRGAVRALRAHLGRFERGREEARLGPGGGGRRYAVRREGLSGYTLEVLDTGQRARAWSLGELLYALDSDLIVQVQRLRPELLFVHAAVVESAGRAHLLIGASGAGKSTTCWGLLQRGFRFVSDELAPIDVDEGTVMPFPRALHLKTLPPGGLGSDARALRTSRGAHVMVPTERSVPLERALPIAELFFVGHDPRAEAPTLTRLRPAEAAARLYPNVLNALAHSNAGLAATAAVATQCSAWDITTAALLPSCDAIANIAQDRPGCVA